MKKNCVVCGKEFETNLNQQKCCTKTCSTIRKNQKIKEYKLMHRKSRVHKFYNYFDVTPPKRCKQESCFTCTYPDCKY